MKIKLVRPLVLATALFSLGLSSCVDPYYGYGGPGYGPPPAAGAVTGGLLGAGAGGIIGNQSGRGLEGAAIGGLLGVLAGSMIENSHRQRRYYDAPPYYHSSDYHGAYGRGGRCDDGHGYRGHSQPDYAPPSYDSYRASNYDPYAWQ